MFVYIGLDGIGIGILLYRFLARSSREISESSRVPRVWRTPPFQTMGCGLAWNRNGRACRRLTTNVIVIDSSSWGACSSVCEICGGFSLGLLKKVNSRRASRRLFFVLVGLVSQDMSLELTVDEVVRGGLDASLELVMLEFGEVGDERHRASDMASNGCAW